MLETKTQPTSHRTRRLDTPRRPAARSAIGNTALESVSAPSLPRRAVAPRISRLSRSEMRLMGMATTCTAIVCGLLLLYLAAYAHVSQLGYDQAEARGRLRQYQLQNESLRAERDRLQSRRHVIQRAIALGMTPRGGTPISYITVRGGQPSAVPKSAVPKSAVLKSDNWKTAAGDLRTASDGKQDFNGDTTAGSDKQPSFHH